MYVLGLRGLIPPFEPTAGTAHNTRTGGSECYVDAETTRKHPGPRMDGVGPAAGIVHEHIEQGKGNQGDGPNIRLLFPVSIKPTPLTVILSISQHLQAASVPP